MPLRMYPNGLSLDEASLSATIASEVPPLVATSLATDDTPAAAAAAAAATAVDDYLATGPVFTPDRTTFFDVSTNLFDRDRVTTGQAYVSGASTPSNSSIYSISDWIPVNPATSYTYAGGTSVVRASYFNAAKTWLSDQNTPTLPATHATPAGTEFIRLTVRTANLDIAQMNLGTSALTYEPGHRPKLLEDYVPSRTVYPHEAAFIDASTNLYDDDLVTENYVLSSGTGALTANSQYVLSDWIPVNSFESYTYAGTVLRASYFTEERAFVSDHSFAVATEAPPNTRVAPAKAKWVRLSIAKVYRDVAQMNPGTTLLAYEPGGYVIPERFLPAPPEPPTPPITVRGVIDGDLSGTFDANVTYPTMSTIGTSQPADIHALYDALMAAHPAYITRTQLGTVDSLPIYAYDFNPPQPGLDSGSVAHEVTKVLVVTGTHGNEKAAIFTTYHFLENLCNEWDADPILGALRHSVRWLVVPVANPTGVRDNTRKNAGGVDLARNWPTGWTLGGDPGASTYGGPSALSEAENVAVNTLLSAHEDALMVVDFHNFHDPADDYYFLWSTPANTETANVWAALIRRMDRKWKADEPTIVDQDPNVFLGRVGPIPPGSLGMEADARGIPGALTFEHCYQVAADPSGSNYDSRTLTWGYEAWVNFLTLALDNL